MVNTWAKEDTKQNEGVPERQKINGEIYSMRRVPGNNSRKQKLSTK